MGDTLRKRAARARYEAARESWRTSSAACPACHDAGIILHEDGELPCPMCRPDMAHEAARGMKP